MRLLILGTAGYHPSETRHTACLMLPEIGVVFDAGTAMFRVREHLCTPTLDIFLTHAHLDHVFGLTFLFDILAGRSVDRVQVHGDAEKLSAVAEHLFAPLLFPVIPPFTWRPLADPVELPDGGRLSWFPLLHPGGSLGYRVDWPDRSLAYVTDTTAHPQADYVQRIRGVDLLVHECNFPDGGEQMANRTGHSCAGPVVQVAVAANVGKLLIVHVDPLADDADPCGLAGMRRVFPNIELARDGMAVDF